MADISQSSDRHIVLVGVISEAILLGFALAWIALSDLSVSLELTTIDLLAGLLLAFVLVFVNFLFYELLTRLLPRPNIFEAFKNEILIPLCSTFTVQGAAIVAVSSGIAEEALFRGAMLVEFERWLGRDWAILCSSVAFGYIHFVGQMRKYWPLLPLYAAVGWVLAELTIRQGNLLGAIVAHSAYNFVAIILLRREAARLSS